MIRVPFVAAVLFCTHLALAQVPASPVPSPQKTAPPQVDVAEVLRRGDMVVVAGEGPRGADEDAMRMATAPPPDESHMWFVTVIKTNNCQYCTKLYSDFQSAPELLAFVSAAAPYKPWGHYNEYNVNDETQKWRIKAYQISGYPTIVIQPPRNGMWGNPRTVVYQTTGYNGNPKKLASDITNGVRKYAAAMSKQGYLKIQMQEFLEGTPGLQQTTPKETSSLIPTPLWGKKEPSLLSLEVPSKSFPVVVGGSNQATPEPSAPVPTETYHRAGSGQYTPAPPMGPVGINPPFAVPPKVDPFNPNPQVQPVQPQPNWPPDQPTPNPSPPSTVPSAGILIDAVLKGLMGLFSSPSITNLSLLFILGLQVLNIIAPMTKTKLDDEALAFLKSIAQTNKAMSGGQTLPVLPPSPTTVSPPSGTPVS